MSNEELLENYNGKINALKTQIDRIIGGIEVLEKLKEEIIKPPKEKNKK